MKTKRTISLLLVTFMLIGMLAGCNSQVQNNGGNNAVPNNGIQEQTQKPTEATQGKTEVAEGDLLKAPEVAVNVGDRLYINFMMDGDEENTTENMEIAVDQITEDTYVLYATNGMLKLNEVIYEVSDNGINKYSKGAFVESFAQDTETSQEVLRTEVDGFLEILSYFMMSHSNYDGLQYKKTEAYCVTLGVEGEVYGYEMYSNGENVGTIYIDGSTGLMLRIAEPNGKTVFSVIEFKTEGVEIPQYK